MGWERLLLFPEARPERVRTGHRAPGGYGSKLNYVRGMSGILLRGTLGQSLRPDLRPAEEKILARVPVTWSRGRWRCSSAW